MPWAAGDSNRHVNLALSQLWAEKLGLGPDTAEKEALAELVFARHRRSCIRLLPTEDRDNFSP